MKSYISKEDAKKIGDRLSVNWKEISPISFWKGINVELEHGSQVQKTNVTKDDPVITGKIALRHLLEDSDYYEKLEKIEAFSKLPLTKKG